jgi:hypothetical protein
MIASQQGRRVERPTQNAREAPETLTILDRNADAWRVLQAEAAPLGRILGHGPDFNMHPPCDSFGPDFATITCCSVLFLP